MAQGRVVGARRGKVMAMVGIALFAMTAAGGPSASAQPAAGGAPAAAAPGAGALAAIETPAVVPVLSDGYEVVDLIADGRAAGPVKGYLLRPAGDRPVPAVVALHGCGGLFRKSGTLAAREADWAARLVAKGYAVLFPDSFNPRGFRQVCTFGANDRPIRPRDRAHDAAAAFRWLAAKPYIDAGRLALLGWSHGGSSVLWAVRRDFDLGGPEIRAAIAFYPGCRVFADSRRGWAPRVPLAILIGSDDDWTPPDPCRVLASRHPLRLVEYPGAVHGFDAPASRRRTRKRIGVTGTGRNEAEIGTDPAARANAIEVVMGTLAGAFADPPRH